MRGRVYNEMLGRAQALLADGVSTVLDGTFSMARPVEAAQQLAAESNATFLAIRCHCRPDVARLRIAHRQTAGSDASEALPEFHERQQTVREAWPTQMPQVQIDTEIPRHEQTAQVIAQLRRQADRNASASL
jgi:predicted kinase